MGEYADMMLDGVFCEGCGEYLGEGNGYTGRCAECHHEITTQEAEKDFKQK